MASHPCRPLSAKLWKGGMSSWLDWRLGNDLHFCKVRSVVFHTELADNSTSPSGNWRGNTSADVPDSFLCAVIFSVSWKMNYIRGHATSRRRENLTRGETFLRNRLFLYPFSVLEVYFCVVKVWQILPSSLSLSLFVYGLLSAWYWNNIWGLYSKQQEPCIPLM